MLPFQLRPYKIYYILLQMALVTYKEKPSYPSINYKYWYLQGTLT